MPFTIWVDADGTPKAIKEILFRVADRRQLSVRLVANRPQALPRSPRISAIQVSKELDAADAYIVSHCEPGDLVVTSDIPLAALVVAKGGTVLETRGQILDSSNVEARLSYRNLQDELRGAWVDDGSGPPPFDAKARERFANALDRWLTRRPS
jgi:uncharacterized protein YaiI (UPF0178 family)